MVYTRQILRLVIVDPIPRREIRLRDITQYYSNNRVDFFPTSLEDNAMKNLNTLTIVTLCLAFSVAAVTPVLAEQYGGHWNNKNMSADMKEKGEHHMDGTVTKVNHQTGFITVKTDDGALRLHYPPKSIKDVEDGTKVRLYLGFNELSKKM